MFRIFEQPAMFPLELVPQQAQLGNHLVVQFAQLHG